MLGSVLDFDPGKVGAVSPVRVFPRCGWSRGPSAAGMVGGVGREYSALPASGRNAWRIVGGKARWSRWPAESGLGSAGGGCAGPRSWRDPVGSRCVSCTVGWRKRELYESSNSAKETMDNICSLVLIRKFVVVSFLNELAKCQVPLLRQW